MHLYFDTSALIKRVISEAESLALVEFVDQHQKRDDLLASSSLTWIEISRAIRSRFPAAEVQVAATVEDAMSGIAERSMAADVVSLARRVDPALLRSLDAIHLASAILVDADVVVTYDDRLADACQRNAFAVASPGRG